MSIPAESIPAEFQNVTAFAKANVYFDGGVISHALQLSDGSKKTLGLIRVGEYHFNTDAPERMEITEGSCRVRLDGQTDWVTYDAGQSFDVPGKSGFDIVVDAGLCQYICSFLVA